MTKMGLQLSNQTHDTYNEKVIIFSFCDGNNSDSK